MKKIYLYLILAYSINFYANDTITAISLENRNLREQATIDSKILSEIKTNDTLKLTSIENNWVKVIYKDSLNGYVENEFLKVLKNYQADILKLNITKKILFKSFILISILCFGLLYLLKKKLIQLEINGKFSLIGKSILLGFILTTIGTVYSFYDQLSFPKIFGIIILLLFLIRSISKIFTYEKDIKIIKSGFLENEKLNMINIDYLENEILNQKKKIDEIKLNKEDIIYKMDILKNNSNQFLKDLNNELESHISDEFGKENLENLIQNKIPIIGMPKELVNIFFGFPEKIIREEKENHIREKFSYGFKKTYYNKDYYQTDITLLNGKVESFIKD